MTSTRKIFSRWNVQLIDESSLFGTDDVSIESHVSQLLIGYRIITHAMKLHYDLFFFFKRYLLYVLSFMSFVLPFFAVRCRLPLFIVFNRLFIIFFLSSFNSRSLSSDQLDSRS